MNPKENFGKKRAAVIGVGLMGGSLGMALRRRGWRVTGVGRDLRKLRRARSLGAIDDATGDVRAGVKDADVVILALPVKDIVSFGRIVQAHLPPGAVVTDVGSVKGPISKAFARWPSFVGAHPMCGSEKTGVVHARPDLYRGAPCLVTPERGTSASAVRRVVRFWRSVGARPLVLSPEEHDRRAALVSHLPHLLAEALVLTVPPGADWVSGVAAGSFRDATRVAAADPGLWAQIYSMNRPAIRRAVSDFQSVLRSLVGSGPDEKKLRGVVERHRALLRENQ